MAQSKRILWRLSVPTACPWAPNIAAIRTTHYKLAAIAYETKRDDESREKWSQSASPNYTVHFSATCLLDGFWVEVRDVPGKVMSVTESGMAAFCAATFTGLVESMVDVEAQLILRAVVAGALPAGVLVDETDKVFTVKQAGGVLEL